MKTVLLPTAYLPPVSWMATAANSEEILVEIHETYPKQTFRNRCKIVTSGGILSLSVPVIKVNGNHTRTFEVMIDNSGNWQRLHWRSIITAYNKSPYFLFYRDLFEPIFYKKHERLIDLNEDLLRVLLNILIFNNLSFTPTTEYTFKPEFTDLRNAFNPKNRPYQKFTSDLPRYIQVFENTHGFIPDMSILDLIFNIGPEAPKYLTEIKLTD